MTKRGEPLPINQALNRPRAKLGLDLSAWMAIVFVTVTVFLVGFRMLAIVSFPMMAGGAWLIVRKHPKMFQLWGLIRAPCSAWCCVGKSLVFRLGSCGVFGLPQSTSGSTASKLAEAKEKPHFPQMQRPALGYP